MYKSTKKNHKLSTLCIIFLASLTFCSCVICSKQGIAVKNSTKDTLLIELTLSDTLDDMPYYLDASKEDTSDYFYKIDTMNVSIKDKRVLISKSSFIPPDSLYSSEMYALFQNKDTCFLYTIKWQDAKNNTIEEIHAKRLYKCRSLTKKDFGITSNHFRWQGTDSAIYEYK